MFSFLAKVFGTKSDRDIKAIRPILEDILAEYATLQQLSDNELRDASTELKAKIADYLSEIDTEISKLSKSVSENAEMALNEKETIFNQIDELEKQRNVELEKILLEILPRAFAIIKETARRFAENGKLVVKATEHDRKIFAQKNGNGLELDGDSITWLNKWSVAGNLLTWNMVHYDEQLIGGVALHQGKISEMATGEGKTLVSTLPSFLNALAGKGVHLVTVNDYLAKRDSEWNAPLFEFHGLTVDCIDKHDPHSEARKNAYLADITYGTNNEFGFDYLRDNMVRSPEEIVQRKHHFAMVDEVDSVLIDDARTPLIISGPVPRGDEQQFYQLKPRVSKLYDAQKTLVNNLLNEAKKKIEAGNTDEKDGGLALFRAHRAMPKYKPLVKYLSEQGIKVVLQKTENFYLQDNQKDMKKADEILFFTIDEKHNTVDLTDKGIEVLTVDGEDQSFFVLPDLSIEMHSIEKNMLISVEERQARTEALIKEYGDKAERIHTVNQLLKAYTMFEKDTEYILVDGKVKIVDENTGRVMEGRRYSDGLHQALEAKENVKVEDATQTYATITLQNYFRMYHKLAGMTGTATTEAAEFWEIYKLDVVTIPTHVKPVRNDMDDKVYKTMREKFNAVAIEIEELNKAGRPVLVGTTSVEISELLSRMLNMKKIKHNVLNAKQHAREADIVAEAGHPGAVTIATNMAGRGTDIKLTPESKAAGGLAIIGTERHESRRVDRQLRGRAGRQGDPGSSQFYLSLEDNLMRMFGSDRIAKLMDRMGLEEGEVIQHSMITSSVERAQKKVEENNFGMRKRLLEYDDVMNMQRKAIYSKRKNALYGDRLQMDIADMIFDMCQSVVTGAKVQNSFENFKYNFIATFGFTPALQEADFLKLKEDFLTQNLYEECSKHYENNAKKIASESLSVFNRLYITDGSKIENVVVPITDSKKQIHVIVPLKKAYESKGLELPRAVEKYSVLSFIDQEWKEHLREMDDLKQSVQNAVYEQKDPLLIYKGEAYGLFNRLISKMSNDTTSFLFKAEILKENMSQAYDNRRQSEPKLKETKQETESSLGGYNVQGGGSQSQQDRPPVERVMPVRSEKVYGRNDTVKVQYMDGSIKEDKYKKLENDILSNRCVVMQ
ncbi:MAG: preprotein translocase subunit SecA [Bacteroidetes bacterium]|nr:MAG: preprotein translocase subunit SecA [Bacteroidota bacterium]